MTSPVSKISTISSSAAIDLRQRVAGRLSELGIKIELPIETHAYQAAGVVAMHIRPQAGAGQKADAILARESDIALIAGVEPRLYVDARARAVVAEFPIAQPPLLYTSSLMPHGKPYNMTLGKRVDGTPLQVDISDASTPHVLVAGTTGAGKSALCHSMLATICAATPRLKVLTYDPIHTGLPWIMPAIRGNLIEALTDPAIMVEKLSRLCEVLDSGRAVPGRVLVYIDELADLIRVQPGITASLIRLATRGRNSNIHLLLATQRPDSKTLGGELVSCMPVRVVLSVAREVDSRTASGDHKIDAHRLPKPGHGVMCSGPDDVRFVAAMPDDYKKIDTAGQPASPGPSTGTQPPLDIRVGHAKPDRREIHMQRDFGLPALPSPKGESEGNAGQTITAEPIQLPGPVTMARPAESYTLEERIRLIMEWNWEISISGLQAALKPGGAQNGFAAVRDVYNRIKSERASGDN